MTVIELQKRMEALQHESSLGEAEVMIFETEIGWIPLTHIWWDFNRKEIRLTSELT